MKHNREWTVGELVTKLSTFPLNLKVELDVLHDGRNAWTDEFEIDCDKDLVTLSNEIFEY